MRKKQVTILELAARLGLSPSTVSRALNGKHRISPATQERVKSLARELGYRPNVSAIHLRENKTSTLGVLIPSLESRTETLLLEAFVTHARQIEHQIILQIGQDEEALRFLLQNHIDGLFLFTGRVMVTDQLIPMVRKLQLPVVVLGPFATSASRVWLHADNASDPGLLEQIVLKSFSALFEEMEAIENEHPFSQKNFFADQR